MFMLSLLILFRAILVAVEADSVVADDTPADDPAAAKLELTLA